MNHALLELNALRVGYRGRAILPPIQAAIRSGEFWGIAGSNGSGKSTLVKTLLNLLPMIDGDVRYSNELKIGYVPQRSSLDLSIPARAIDVIEGGASRGWSFVTPFLNAAQREAIRDAMAKTRTTELAYAQLGELSEGQKQRVLMARALVGNPELLVLDEPTSAMDAPTELDMLHLLRELQTEHQLAILLVSHNLYAMCSVITHALMLDREHQLILSGDVRDVAVHHEVHEHFGRLMRVAVEERFGPLKDPEACSDCDH